MSDLHGIKLSKEKIQEILKGHINSNITGYERKEKAYMNWTGEIKLEDRNNIILKVSNQPDNLSLKKEKRCYDLLKDKIPTPQMIGYDFSKEKHPYEYLILEKLKGEELSTAWNKLSIDEQKKISREMGKTLAKMHSIKFNNFGWIYGTEKESKSHTTAEDFIKSLIEKDIREHREDQFLDENSIEKIESFLKNNINTVNTDEKARFTHLDYTFWHIFIKEKSIEGVIDYGFATKNIREADFVKLRRWVFPRGKHIEPAFKEGYTSIQSLGEEHDRKVKYMKILMDAKFVHRLYKTGEEEKAQKYKRKVDEMINNFL